MGQPSHPKNPGAVDVVAAPTLAEALPSLGTTQAAIFPEKKQIGPPRLSQQELVDANALGTASAAVASAATARSTFTAMPRWCVSLRAVMHAHPKRTVLAVLMLLGILAAVVAGAVIGSRWGRNIRTVVPRVDLDYAIYDGVYDDEYDMDVYRGIRYAARPERWRLPQRPTTDRTAVIAATADSVQCPQSPMAPMFPDFDFNWNTTIYGNEDCLFLNVFSPHGADNLPVMVWIHGGGYGTGSVAGLSFTSLAGSVDNVFVTVLIQYRLGAFGFLSSAEIAQHNGTLNAGLHDIRFALQWVQDYAARFGGDPARVTIAGESAGGGAVLLLATMDGGGDGSSLFRRAAASSPYVPTQPALDSDWVTAFYDDFARRAGCLGVAEENPGNGSVLACLRARDSLTLQNASALASYLGPRYGQWAFVPVTDGDLVRGRPTQRLVGEKTANLNGVAVLTGNNANEGFDFVPQNITTRDDFLAWLRLNYPALGTTNVSTIMRLYTVPDNVTATSPRFNTDGRDWPFATSTSGLAVAWQQAANNLYAETTFVCPSYWLADAYAAAYDAPAAWRYQFSIPNALHGLDVSVLEGDSVGAIDAGFRTAFQQLWGQFVASGRPTLTDTMAMADSESHTGRKEDEVSAAETGSWAAWGNDETDATYSMLNLNYTSVTPYGPYTADWAVVDGHAWEGGRGERCKLWAELGGWILE